MSCICVDIVTKERALIRCDAGAQSMSSSQRDLVADYTSQFLIGLGRIITSHPDVKSQVDTRIGDNLISLGRKLLSPTRTRL